VAAGDLTLKQRDRLLAEMTDEVGELVLRDNILQNLALSIGQGLGPDLVDAQIRLMRRLESAGRLEEAYEWVRGLKESPFTRVFKRGVGFFSELRPGAVRAGTDVRGLSPAQLEVLRIVLEKEEGEERDALSGGIAWLAIIATVSPLLGLLGTVLGVMHSFMGVMESGSSSIAAVAPGVAEALVTTAGGLVVAIPAAMAFNYLTGRLNRFMGELEGISSELIGTLAREGRI